MPSDISIKSKNTSDSEDIRSITIQITVNNKTVLITDSNHINKDNKLKSIEFIETAEKQLKELTKRLYNM